MKLKTLTLVCSLLVSIASSIDAQIDAKPNDRLLAKQSPVAAEVYFVAAGMENARRKFRCGQAKVVRHEITPKELYLVLRAGISDPERFQKGDKDTETLEMAQWYYQEPKLSMVIQPSNPDSSQDQVIYNRLVANAKEAKILSEYNESAPQAGGVKQNNAYHFGLITYPETVLKSGLWVQGNILDPRFYAYYYAGKPLDQLFVEYDPPAIYRGEAVLEGSRCMKIELPLRKGLQTLYWVDIEHGFVVRRLEDYQKIGDKLVMTRELQVPRLVESDGIWLPGLVESKSYFRFPRLKTDKDKDGRPLPKSGVPAERVTIDTDFVTLPPRITRVTISDFKADCNLPPNVFEMEWPDGTQVQDSINQKNFVIETNDGGKKKQNSEEAGGQVQEKPKS